MWRSAGLFRSREGLTLAVEALERAPMSAPATADAWRHHNLLTVARLIARAARRREESRGGHFRLDYPERNDSLWKRRIMETVE
jgi:L-aspartate oxidase